MAFPEHYEKNVSLDAVLVHAAMHGAFALAAMQTGLKPDEAFGRAEWLKKQPKAYINQVVAEVEKLHDHEGEENATSTV